MTTFALTNAFNIGGRTKLTFTLSAVPRPEWRRTFRVAAGRSFRVLGMQVSTQVRRGADATAAIARLRSAIEKADKAQAAADARTPKIRSLPELFAAIVAPARRRAEAEAARRADVEAAIKRALR